MNRIYYLTIIISLVLFISSCTKVNEQDRANVGTLTKPIASFSYTGNDHPAPVTIHFTNSSEYSDSFKWDFGDGYTTTETNPTHVYQNNTDQPISYLVILKAINTNTGEENKRSKSISILPGNK